MILDVNSSYVMATRTNNHSVQHNNYVHDKISNLSQPPTKKRVVLNEVKSKLYKLPVFKHKERFLELLNDNDALVIVGETGSGKTTQIPKWCVDYLKKSNNFSKGKQLCVACTQPRRIAAMSVSARVAEELNVTLGEEVGYSVRFESSTSSKTVLKYLTDGMLLREAMLDNQLNQYGIIIIDEAHERTLATEILLGVVKMALKNRNRTNNKLLPLKVIVMSATIKVELFKNYLNAPELNIKGRQHNVADFFAEVPQSDLLTSSLITVFQIHRENPCSTVDGDILVFCSGQDEIQSLVTMCKKTLKHAPATMQNLIPLPLYASLPPSQQLRVFEVNQPVNAMNGNGPSTSNGLTNLSYRRVIFSTNVAETSVTIPKIRWVVDTGKVKCNYYCPKTSRESLKIIPISKAQASQRSGRAGRISAGECYRLYTSEEYEQMRDYLLPEIKRCNLDGVILQMISIGIDRITSFEFLEKPEESRIKAALANLLSLRAIKTVKTQNHDDSTISNNVKETYRSNDNILNYSYELTNTGKKLSTFPLSPALARVIIAADELNCLDETLTIISLLYIENLFHIPPNKQSEAEKMLEKFYSNEGDSIMLLRVFKAFKKTCALNKAGLKLWCAEHFINIKNLRLARLIRKQLSDLCIGLGMKQSSCGQETSLVRRALTYGLFNNVATMWNGKYRNKSMIDIYIHPSSCLFRSKPECILYFELLETNKCYMRNCTLIDMCWVNEISTANLTKS